MNARDEPRATMLNDTFVGMTLARRRRTAVGIGVIFMVLLFQFVTRSSEGHPPMRVLARLLVATIAMPPLFIALSLGFARATQRRLGALPMLVLGALMAGVLGAALGSVILLLTQHFPILEPRSGPWKLHRALLFGFVYGELGLGLWALAFVFPFAVEDAHVRSLESDKLRLEADKLRTAAELAQLRAHLEPHFLLNTLSAIAGLVTEDLREARRLLACLGDLLREALRGEDSMQTLDEQVGWLRRYAEILQARHRGNLSFRWEISEETRNVLLPRLLLQPLVENAVKHGALRRASGGEVIVRATLAEDAVSSTGRVICIVEDNGPGVAESETRSGAFGLHAVRRRLELKYTAHASLRLESSPLGTRSIVELPRDAGVAMAGPS